MEQTKHPLSPTITEYHHVDKRLRRRECNLSENYVVNEIPEEILQIIFLHLECYSPSAALTCKTWFRIVSDQNLIRSQAQEALDSKDLKAICILAFRLLLGEIEQNDEFLAFKLIFKAGEEFSKRAKLTCQERFVLGHMRFRENTRQWQHLKWIQEGPLVSFQSWADKGNAFAIYSLAIAAFSTDLEKSLALFRQAAEKNFIAAIFAQFTLLPEIEGQASLSNAEILPLLQKAADLGSSEAQYYLSEMQGDKKLRKQNLLKAAEMGSHWAQYELAEDLASFSVEGCSWMIKSARQGNIWAQAVLGEELEMIREYQSDLGDDYAWVKEAEAKGEQQIYFYLGKNNSNIFEWKIWPDLRAPFNFDHIFTLCALFLRGKLVPQNPIKAWEYFHQFCSYCGDSEKSVKFVGELKQLLEEYFPQS